MSPEWELLQSQPRALPTAGSFSSGTVNIILPLSVDSAPVQKAGSDSAQVFRIGEDTRIAGIAAVQNSCDRIMHGSNQRETVFLDFGRGTTLREEAGLSAGRLPVEREVAGVRQGESIEYVLLGIVAQPFARDVLQDVLQGDEIQTAVHEIRTRTEIPPRFCRDDSHQGIRAVSAEPLCHILY